MAHRDTKAPRADSEHQAPDLTSNRREEEILVIPSISYTRNTGWKSCQYSTTQHASDVALQSQQNATSKHAAESKTWSGILLKKGHALLRPWQPRWFELKGTETGQALLVYISPNKGSQSLHVEDARRELHLDSGVRIAFSLGVSSADPTAASVRKTPTPPRVGGERSTRLLLMAATDVEAMAFLSCLRGILAPGRAPPAHRVALHFPAHALAQLIAE
jgi:hypothetical protein